MFVQISGTVSEPRLQVHEAGNLKGLHVLAPESWSERHVADALHADSWGGPVTDGHAWLDVGTLRQHAGAGAEPGWNQQFDAMIEYARGKGWCDDSGALVRAHIEFH